MAAEAKQFSSIAELVWNTFLFCAWKERSNAYLTNQTTFNFQYIWKEPVSLDTIFQFSWYVLPHINLVLK